ncbi:BON domain-containing protein [Lichenicoccus roseus]|uniref:BON domain-containing protein n=1 Tax=Lichenicoccus roseus TaxID=2683649 RepID=A0A5R9JJJ4_9PROT|nr:BON domain-containing protein [Lichenicoccus roseus]TLU74528.1 BON domain-containing protein [Lichenicoccus roseus]
MSHDSDLQSSVLAEMAWEPSIAAGHIGVTARNGIVTLSGHVDSFLEKNAAEEAARRVKGVKGVAGELEVRLAFDMTRGDDDIASAAISRLAWDTAVPRDAIQVEVERGWVTLTGDVRWHFEKEAAATDVRNLAGVTGLTDKVTIKAAVSTLDISDSIMDALHRSWFFDPKTVTVTAEGGHVRLSGTVRSLNERRVAANTAWAAPGTSDVQNDLVVV